MRAVLALIASGILSAALVACGHNEPYPYPASAQQQFHRSCPADNAVCACTWDKLTRSMSYEEYQTALERFRDTGLMEPKVTRARTTCTEQHGS